MHRGNKGKSVRRSQDRREYDTEMASVKSTHLGLCVMAAICEHSDGYLDSITMIYFISLITFSYLRRVCTLS